MDKTTVREQYAQEIVRLLSEENEHDILQDHVLYEQLIREDPFNRVVIAVSVPPPIQAVIVECRNLHHDQVTFKMCGIQDTPEAKQLQLKQEILKEIIENWMSEILATNKTVRDALEGKNWAPHMGNFWKMLFIERLPKPVAI